MFVLQGCETLFLSMSGNLIITLVVSLVVLSVSTLRASTSTYKFLSPLLLQSILAHSALLKYLFVRALFKIFHNFTLLINGFAIYNWTSVLASSYQHFISMLPNTVIVNSVGAVDVSHVYYVSAFFTIFHTLHITYRFSLNLICIFYTFTIDFVSQ